MESIKPRISELKTQEITIHNANTLVQLTLLGRSGEVDLSIQKQAGKLEGLCSRRW
jgi:hypothetical protein